MVDNSIYAETEVSSTDELTCPDCEQSQLPSRLALQRHIVEHHLFDPEQYGPTRLKVAGSTLDLIPSFKPTATPLLGRNLPACLEVWKGTYDVIVLDSAPLLPVADTFTIAPYCTHTVLVSNLKRSDRRSFRTAAERLTLMGIPVVGTVVTRVRERSLHSREYRRYIRAGVSG